MLVDAVMEHVSMILDKHGIKYENLSPYDNTFRTGAFNILFLNDAIHLMDTTYFLSDPDIFDKVSNKLLEIKAFEASSKEMRFKIENAFSRQSVFKYDFYQHFNDPCVQLKIMTDFQYEFVYIRQNCIIYRYKNYYDLDELISDILLRFNIRSTNEKRDK